MTHLYTANNVVKHGFFQESEIIQDAGYPAHPCSLLKALTYGKPFYYLLCKTDILYILSDILYRI